MPGTPVTAPSIASAGDLGEYAASWGRHLRIPTPHTRPSDPAFVAGAESTSTRTLVSRRSVQRDTRLI